MARECGGFGSIEGKFSDHFGSEAAFSRDSAFALVIAESRYRRTTCNRSVPPKQGSTSQRHRSLCGRGDWLGPPASETGKTRSTSEDGARLRNRDRSLAIRRARFLAEKEILLRLPRQFRARHRLPLQFFVPRRPLVVPHLRGHC